MTPNISITLLRTQTDERLVALVAAGHERAFDAIVERYSRPLLRHARRLLGEDGRAEDVVQAAFVSAWTALNEGTAVRDLRPWLYRIVHNGALNAMKKPGGADAPLTEMHASAPGPEAEVLQREDVRRALDTISGLPERQRAALLAVALEGRSHADVGQDLGIDDTAVRQLVSRARRSLRVAATAVTPWPAASWLAGAGSAEAGDTAARVGEIVGGVGAGTMFGGAAVKAGAIVAATGAIAVGAPQVAHVVREDPSPARAAPAARTPAAGTLAGRGDGSSAPGSPARKPAADGAPAAGDTRVEARSDDRRQGDGELGSPGGSGAGDERSDSGRHGDGGSTRSGDGEAGRERSGEPERQRSHGSEGRKDQPKRDRSARSGDDGGKTSPAGDGRSPGKSESDDQDGAARSEPAGDRGDGAGQRPERQQDGDRSSESGSAEGAGVESAADSSVTSAP